MLHAKNSKEFQVEELRIHLEDKEKASGTIIEENIVRSKEGETQDQSQIVCY